MRLWLLKAKDSVPYDAYDGFVIRAETDKQARAIAQENGGSECGHFRDRKIAFWINEHETTCVELLPDESDAPWGAKVILGSFNAG